MKTITCMWLEESKKEVRSLPSKITTYLNIQIDFVIKFGVYFFTRVQFEAPEILKQIFCLFFLFLFYSYETFISRHKINGNQMLSLEN